jgi:hypothetical protein
VRVVAGVDQLRDHAHPVGRALDAAFHDMRDSELLSDLAQVALRSRLVLHYRRATDHPQVGDLRQIAQNLILHTIGEKLVVGIAAEVFKRQHGDALF